MRVELSAGGARARVWWKTDENKEEVSDALERASGFIRSRVAEALGTKRTPELVFRWDPGDASGERRAQPSDEGP